MNFRKNIFSVSISSVLLALAGCGVTSQDQGTGDSGAAVSGVAVDGYVARAVVYVDTNENNKLDVWEPRALTDGRGYFTYSPSYVNKNGNTVDATKYCELLISDPKYAHCLKIPAGYDEVMIRMTKGYDLTTVEPFTGTLSMRTSSNSGAIESFMVATPITGLLAEMTAVQKTSFYTNETDLDDSFSNLDFLDFDTVDLMTEAQRLVLLKLALRIHKVADSVAGVLDDELDPGEGFFDVKEGMPTDASIYVYRAIANASISSAQDVSTILTNQSIMEGVVTQAWAKMKVVINNYNLTKDAGDQYQIPATDPDYSAIAGNAVSLANAVGTVFANPLVAEGTYTDSNGDVQNYSLEDDAKSRIRAIDIMASLIRSKADAAAIANAQSLLSDASYMANLKSSKVDITGLKKKFKDNAGSVVAGDANYDTRKSFASLLGGDSASTTGLTGTDGGAANELGFANNTMEMSDNGDATKIAFEGATPDATSGTMTIGATFTEGDFAKKDANGDPEPLELSGTWEQLDEYTMLMNVEVAGVVEPVIVKPTLTDDGQTAYYFDLGGEQQVWIP